MVAWGTTMAQTAIGMSRISLLFIAGLLLALGSPAGAVTYAKFYTGGDGYTGPYNSSGTVYEATKGLSTNCPSVGSCPSSDVLADPMLFTSLGITATAPGSVTVNGTIYQKRVWDDLAPPFGGLGAGRTQEGSGADQIEGSDELVLAFSSSVKLTGVGTLFAGAHTPFGSGYPTVSSVSTAAATIQFQMAVCVLGICSSYSPFSFALANAIGLSLTGDTFKFMQLTGNPSFYVSALAYEVCGPPGAACAPPQVPIPGALPLFATGLIGLAWLGRRRKRKNATALAA
jgi:hypothetical protein